MQRPPGYAPGVPLAAPPRPRTGLAVAAALTSCFVMPVVYFLAVITQLGRYESHSLVPLGVAVAAGFALWAAAVVDAPDSANAQFAYAIALVERGRTLEALARCEAAARIAPGWTEPQGCIGGLLDRMGRPVEAGRAFRRMRANGRASTSMWLSYAQHLGRQGAREAALVELDAMRRAGRWDAAAQRYRDRLAR